MRSLLELAIEPQPDDVTCGPTCLHAIYGYYGDELPLDEVIRGVVPLGTSGTLAVLLARHALERGYRATIYTYNLHVFDPTWFDDVGRGPRTLLERKLGEQADAKADAKLRFATAAYLRFLELGGRIRFVELSPELIRTHLNEGRPILTGLSATYLYGSERERGELDLEPDDVRGDPVGHFVVLCGYEPEGREVLVADPLHDNPRYGPGTYRVPMQRVLGAILLGVLTYDANFLVVEPPGEEGAVEPPGRDGVVRVLESDARGAHDTSTLDDETASSTPGTEAAPA